MGNICYLVFHVHLCPVGPEYLIPVPWLFTLSTSRRPYGSPLARAWFISYFLGPQTSLGLYYYHVLMPCFTDLFTIVRGAHVLFRNCGVFSRYRQAQSHFRVPSRLQPLAQTSGSVPEPANFVAGSLMGWPLKCFMNPVIALSWMPRWVLSWFFRGWSSVCCYLCTPAW